MGEDNDRIPRRDGGRVWARPHTRGERGEGRAGLKTQVKNKTLAATSIWGVEVGSCTSGYRANGGVEIRHGGET
jgi:hypothetical protein